MALPRLSPRRSDMCFGNSGSTGRCVAAYLEQLYGHAEAALKASLDGVTLAQLTHDVAGRLRSVRTTTAR